MNEDEILKHIPVNRNILFIDSMEIQENILSSILEISDVKIYKGIPNALKIIVEENSPSLIWLTQERVFLVNNSGVAYKEVVTPEGFESIPKVIDKKNIQISTSQKLVSDRFISFLEHLNSNFHDQVNLNPEYYFLEETTVDLYLKTKEGIVIKFDSLREPVQQISNLKVVLMEKRQEINEYVDLRVNGWVYYK